MEKGEKDKETIKTTRAYICQLYVYVRLYIYSAVTTFAYTLDEITLLLRFSLSSTLMFGKKTDGIYLRR